MRLSKVYCRVCEIRVVCPGPAPKNGGTAFLPAGSAIRAQKSPAEVYLPVRGAGSFVFIKREVPCFVQVERVQHTVKRFITPGMLAGCLCGNLQGTTKILAEENTSPVAVMGSIGQNRRMAHFPAQRMWIAFLI